MGASIPTPAPASATPTKNAPLVHNVSAAEGAGGTTNPSLPLALCAPVLPICARHCCGRQSGAPQLKTSARNTRPSASCGAMRPLPNSHASAGSASAQITKANNEIGAHHSHARRADSSGNICNGSKRFFKTSTRSNPTQRASRTHSATINATPIQPSAASPARSRSSAGERPRWKGISAHHNRVSARMARHNVGRCASWARACATNGLEIGEAHARSSPPARAVAARRRSRRIEKGGKERFIAGKFRHTESQ